MKEVINKLIEKNITISIMESCTGGFIASSITNIEGASQIFKFGAVTYSNEYKIKMGVNKKTIDKYTVYSIEVAREMAKTISKFTSSDIAIGVTGKINREDINNPGTSNNIIYYSIYIQKDNRYYDVILNTINDTRINNKKYIMESITNKLLEIINTSL